MNDSNASAIRALPSGRAGTARELTASLRPARALAHPLWLGALALLILNDHVLKGASLLPGVLTGKLSDVAGLVMAPPLLAALLRLRSRRALILAHLAVGVVFAAINVSAGAAAGFEALMALGPLPWHITVDPTDLFALPALAGAWWLCRVGAARPIALARPFGALAAGVGVLAAMATSPQPVEPVFPSMNADLVLGTLSNETLILRIRPLRDSVYVDCGEAIRNPTAALSRELFGPAVAWQIEPGRVVQAHGDGFSMPSGACFAALVDGTLHRPGNGAEAGRPVPMTLLFWTAEQFPMLSIPSTTEGAPPARFVQVLSLATGARWAPHSAIFPAPPEAAPQPIPGCEPAPEGGVIDWQLPVPVGTRTLEAVSSGPDSCHRLTFAGSGAWYVCTGTDAIPFVAGDRVHLGVTTTGQRFRAIDGVELIGDGDALGKRLSLARGADLATWGGTGGWTTRDLPECGSARGPCGSLVRAQELGIEGADGVIHVMAGDFVTLQGTLFLQRAERIPIGDSACLPEASDGLVLESVYVEPRFTEE